MFLTAEIQNNSEESVIVYAMETKAFAMLRAIMTTHGDMGLFEETNLAAYTCTCASSLTQTMVSSLKSTKASLLTPTKASSLTSTKASSLTSTNASLLISTKPSLLTSTEASWLTSMKALLLTSTMKLCRPPTKIITCLDIVGNMGDRLIEKEILDITPIRALIQKYRFPYCVVFTLIFVLHVICMGIFSRYNLPQFSVNSNATAGSVGRTEGSSSFWFLFWPFMIMLLELYFNFDMVNVCCRKRVNLNTSGMQYCRFIRDFPVLHILHVSAFSASVIAWFIAKLLSSDAELYLLATALLLGWTYTLYLLTFIPFIHVMLHSFIAWIYGAVKYLIFGVFIHLGFSFAMHSLFHIPQSIAKDFPTEWESLFYVINIAVGMADGIFDSDFDTSYKLVGSSSVVLKMVYIIYAMLTAIIVVNMFITGMTPLTSPAAVTRYKRMWEVSRLRFALQVRVKLSSC